MKDSSFSLIRAMNYGKCSLEEKKEWRFNSQELQITHEKQTAQKFIEEINGKRKELCYPMKKNF